MYIMATTQRNTRVFPTVDNSYTFGDRLRDLVVDIVVMKAEAQQVDTLGLSFLSGRGLTSICLHYGAGLPHVSSRYWRRIIMRAIRDRAYCSFPGPSSELTVNERIIRRWELLTSCIRDVPLFGQITFTCGIDFVGIVASLYPNPWTQVPSDTWDSQRPQFQIGMSLGLSDDAREMASRFQTALDNLNDNVDNGFGLDSDSRDVIMESSTRIARAIENASERGVQIHFDDDVKLLLNKILQFMEKTSDSIKEANITKPLYDLGAKLETICKVVPGIIVLSIIGVYAYLNRESVWGKLAMVVSGLGIAQFFGVPSAVAGYFKSWIESDRVKFQAYGIEDFVGKMSFLGALGLCAGSKTWKPNCETFLRNVGSFDRASSGMAGIFSFAVDCFEKAINWIRSWVGYEDKISLLSSSRNDMTAWIDEVNALYKKHTSGALNITRENFELVLKLRYKGQEFLSPGSVFSDTVAMKASVNYYLRVLNELEQPFKAANIAGYGPRFEPICIYMHGRPGVGKTWATIPLVLNVMAQTLPDSEIPGFKLNHMDYIYSRQHEHKFWDGYRGQWCTVFDDFGQVRDVVGVSDNECMDLIRTGNIFPNVLHMASLESKGNTYFNSKLIVCTGNRANFESGINSIHEPQAVTRRFDFFVQVVPVASWCVDPQANVDSRKLDRTKVDIALCGRFDSGIYEFHVRQNNGPVEVLDYDTFTERIVIEHYKRMNKTSNFFDALNVEKDEALRKRDQWKAKFQDGDSEEKMSMKEFIEGAIDSLDPDMRNEYHRRFRVKAEVENVYSQYLDVGAERTFAANIPDQEPLEGVTPEVREGAEQVKFPPSSFKSLDDVYGGVYSLPSATNHLPFTAEYMGKVMRWLTDPNVVADGCLVDRLLVASYNRLPISERLGTSRWAVSVVFAYGGEKFDFKANPFHVVTLVLNSEARLLHARLVNSTTQPHRVECDPSVKQKITSWYDSILAHIKTFWDRWGGIIKPIIIFVGSYKLFKFAFSFMNGDQTETKPQFQDSGDRGRKKVTLQAQSIGKAKLQASDNNTDDVLDKVLNRSLYTLWHGHSHLGAVIAIKNTRIIMPCHFRTRILKHKKDMDERSTRAKTIFLRSLNGATEIELDYEDLEKRAYCEFDRDMCIIDLDIHTFFPNIEKLFVMDDDVKKNPDLPLRLACPKKVPNDRKIDVMDLYITNGKFEEDCEVDSEAGSTPVKITRPVSYKAPTKAGDCGYPIFLYNPSVARKLFGFHIAGVNNHTGFGCSITQEVLNHFNEKLELVLSGGKEVPPVEPVQGRPVFQNGGMVLHGDAEVGFNQPCASKLRKSLVYGAWMPAKKRPAALVPVNREGVLISPLERAVSRYSDPPPEIAVDYLEEIGDFLLQRLRRSSHVKVCKDVLTYEEAVLGVPYDEYIGPIPRGTSSGYPLAVMPIPGFPGKTWYFGREAKFDLDRTQSIRLKEEVLTIIRDASKGIRQRHFFIDILKDELRAHEKVLAVKTRLISGCPIAYMIAWRMYFLPFSAWLMRNHTANHCAVGINPYSDKWHGLYKRLKAKSDYGIDADISGFDTSETEQIFQIICKMINKWFNDGNHKIRETLFLDVWNSWHISGKKLYEWKKGLPSGHPFTTIINCLYLLIVIVGCWVEKHNGEIRSLTSFFDHVYPVVYGDDSIMALSNYAMDNFNLEHLIEYGRRFGINFTSGAKDGTTYKYKTIEELTFLKRSFRYDDTMGRAVAPLDLDTVLEMPYWYTKGAANLERQYDNFDNALMELSMHDPSVWDKWAPIMIAAMRDKAGYEPEFTSRVPWLAVAVSAVNMW